MSKRTPDEEVAFQMQKLKDMGVTISTRLAWEVSPDIERPATIITAAAKAAGIHDTEESK